MKVRTLIYRIVACFLASTGVVIMLILTSGVMKDRRSSFLRVFPSHPILEGNSYDLKSNSYYIAGCTNSRFYLGTYLSPLNLISLGRNFSDTVHIQLDVEGIYSRKFWSARVRIDSPVFYVHDGAVPRIYKGNLSTWTAKQLPIDQEYFLDIEPINQKSFFVKSLSISGESTLGIFSLDSPQYQFFPGILKKQVDGVFCVDGTLLVDRAISKLIYVYRYRNEFMVLDTSMQLVYKGKTIDTTNIAKVKVAVVPGTNLKTLAEPPLIVNKGACTYNNHLLINSYLLARNEHPKALEKAAVIDVYDLNTSSYEFSFYIANFNGNEKLREFSVCGNKLLVLFDHTARVYDLRDRYFK